MTSYSAKVEVEVEAELGKNKPGSDVKSIKIRNFLRLNTTFRDEFNIKPFKGENMFYHRQKQQKTRNYFQAQKFTRIRNVRG